MDVSLFSAAIRITVDGGTNRWLSWLRRHKLEDKLKQPNFITGDMDSCFNESLTFFNESRVIQTVDQDETDFTKSLRVLEPFVDEMNLENVVVLCETSGRIDQILANINSELTCRCRCVCVGLMNDLVSALFKNHLRPPEISRPVFMLSDNSISWLLSDGHHDIHIPENVKNLWCSMVPFEPTTVTSSGLKWNLTNQTMRYGGIVSTSNKYDTNEDTVKITTDHPLLWSMGISTVDDE